MRSCNGMSTIHGEEKYGKNEMNALLFSDPYRNKDLKRKFDNDENYLLMAAVTISALIHL